MHLGPHFIFHSECQVSRNRSLRMGTGQHRIKAESRTLDPLFLPSARPGGATCMSFPQSKPSSQGGYRPPHLTSSQLALGPVLSPWHFPIQLSTNWLFLFCSFQTVCTQRLCTYALSPVTEANKGKENISF